VDDVQELGYLQATGLKRQDAMYSMPMHAPLAKGLEPMISGSDLFVSPEVSCVHQLLVVRRAHSQLVPIPPSKERSDKFVDSADGAALFDALAWIGRRRG
jgi:hypothetical protein